MGASLVAQVLASWTHVSDRAFRVLVRMAVTALDKPMNGNPPNIYRGGRELLAMSLRSEKGSMDTRYRAVKRAVAELSEAGAIQHLASGWAGQNAVYRLTLGQSASATSDNPPGGMGGLIDPPVGGSIGPPSGGPVNVNEGGFTGPPKEHEEEILERGEEEVGLSSTTSHPPRATALPTPKNCPDHLISLKPRTDGTQACPFCRRGVPPFEPTLATVTSIDSRRPA